MNKLMILASSVILSTAVCAQAQNCIIQDSNGTELKVSSINPQSSGDLRYTAAGSNIQTIIKKGKYKWAWIPKPKSIRDADSMLEKDAAGAAEKYAEAGRKYQLVGWDVYCQLKGAEALAKQGKKADAAKSLDSLVQYNLVNPKLEDDLMSAYKLQTELYLELGQGENALPALNRMLVSTDDNTAAYAFLRKGDVLAKKNDRNAAVLSYFQAALLFPQSKDRPEALYKSAQMLREMKDNRASKFDDILKKEYPNYQPKNAEK